MVFTAEDRILIKICLKVITVRDYLLNFPRKTGKKEDSKNCCVRSAKLVAAIDDMALRCFKKWRAQELTAQNRATRLIRAKLLLKRYTDNEVDFMWFTGEKVFTVAILFVTIDVECIVLI